MKPSAVLFDCDGVLVDSEPETLRVIHEDLIAHGMDITLHEMEERFVGGTVPAIAERVRAIGVDLPDDWSARVYDKIYAALAENVALMDGVPELLDILDAAGVPYAVGSNGTPEKMDLTLGQHPDVYARLKGRLFSGQALNCAKPDPGLYLHAAAAVNAAPEQAVVIEDSATGARAAARAGMRCFGYAPHGKDQALRDEGAVIFTSMRDLPGLLGL